MFETKKINQKLYIISMEKQIPSSPNPQTSRGVYGFVMSMGFVLLIVVYFLWIIIPTSVTKTWSYEPPQKYWAVAIPIFSTTALFLFAFCIYPAMHSRHDGELYEQSAFRDKYSISNGSQVRNLEIPLFDDDEPLELTSPINKKVPARRKGMRIGLSKIRKTEHPPPPGASHNRNDDEILITNLKLYDENNLLVKSLSKRKIPTASDLELSQVCKLLYLNKTSATATRL